MTTSETDYWARIDSEQAQAESEEATPPRNGSRVSPAASTTPAPDPPLDAGQSSQQAPSAPAVRRPAEPGTGKSKSQRIREFFAEHPEARNRDVVEALSSYGVTNNDVANVKTQMRKKAEKQKQAKTRVEPAPAPHGRAAQKTAGPAKPTASPTTPAQAPNHVAMGEIEAGLNFIEHAGGIQRARQIIDLIARIRDVPVD